MTTVRFNVLGNPAPQAGMRAFKVGEQIRMASTGGKHLSDWRHSVSVAAAKAAQDVLGCISGPVAVSVTFRFAMPESRPKRFRAFGMYKVSAPDNDKLQRALGDALKVSGLIADDARIVVWHVDKIEVWQQWTGAIVQVSSIDLIPSRLVTDVSTAGEQVAVERQLAASLEL
jgi:Holliday junction resolvase RusA-like endonuclease